MSNRPRAIRKIEIAAANGRRARRAGSDDGPQPAAKIDLAELNGLAGFLLRRAQLWTFQDFIRTLAPLDIRPAQFSVLAVIDANAGLSQMALAQALGIERAGLVRLLDGLEARGFLTRVPSTVDRRSHALYLTGEGGGALARMRTLVQRHEKHLIGKLGRGQHRRLAKALAVFAEG